MRRTALFRLVSSVLIAGALTALAWGGLRAGIFGGFQLRFVDALFPSIGPHPRIAVVEIDDDSLIELGERGEAWPWDRTIHARLIDRLRADGAALVGYDITFSEPGDDPRSDAALADSLREGENVVLAAAAIFPDEELPEQTLRAESFDEPIRDLAEGAVAIGHANIVPDTDGVSRALPILIEDPEGNVVPSLSFALFAIDEGLSGPITFRPDGVQLGGELVPAQQAQLLDINFADFKNEGTRASAIDVLDGRTPPGTFRDRIVLVGATALGLGDLRFTPLDKRSGEPGVRVHANALNTMLQRAYLSQESTTGSLISVFVIALLVALAVAFTRVWISPVMALGLGAAFVLVAFRRFDGGLVMNMVYPILAVALSYVAALGVRYFTEARERRRVTRVFSRYVAGDVVQEVLAAPEGALATLQGALRPLSVLFADLRGFTAASEDAPPEQVVSALNVYLDAMTRAVNEERGTVDKFMGDCVMAFWGAPRPDADHAHSAVRAGLRMLLYIDEAVQAGAVEGLKVKGCGVGISTGQAVVGNIGSAERLDYTVIGDTVNTASRLCGVAGPGEIVVTDRTAEALGDEFTIAALPSLKVKGKVAPLRVFQILRPGQRAAEFEEGAVVEYGEEKGEFEAEIRPEPPKAAGYAPIEPVPEKKPPKG